MENTVWKIIQQSGLIPTMSLYKVSYQAQHGTEIITGSKQPGDLLALVVWSMQPGTLWFKNYISLGSCTEQPTPVGWELFPKLPNLLSITWELPLYKLSK